MLRYGIRRLTFSRFKRTTVNGRYSMAPSQSHRHSGKRGGQQALSLSSNTNFDQPSTSSSRKLTKRKIGDTNPSRSYPSTSISENGISSLPLASSHQGVNASGDSENLRSFKAQATNADIETDGPSTVSVDAVEQHDTGPEENSPKNAADSLQNEEQSITSLSEFSIQDQQLIKITSFVNNLAPEYVVKLMHGLKRQNRMVTKESLLDEIMRHEIPNSYHKEQSFPQSNSRDRATSNLPYGRGQSGLPSQSSSGARNGSAAQTTRAATGPSQNSQSAGGAKRSEDQVDEIGSIANSSGAQSNNRRPTIDPKSPAAVYQSKINNISSHSSAKDVSSSGPSAQGRSQKTNQNTSVGKSSNQAQRSLQNQQASNLASAPAVNHQPPPEDTVDGVTALAPAQNDLNRESLYASKGQVTKAPSLPLKMLDPAQHLAMCLKLVRDENKRLDASRLCGQCRVKARDITFLPCGHVWACRSCAGPLYVCPCCNKKIIATVDTFLS